MPLSQSGSIYLPPSAANARPSQKGAEISYQAMTVAAILLLIASLWVF